MEDAEAHTLFNRMFEGEPPAPDIAPFIGAAQRDTVRRHWALAGAGLATAAVMVGAVVAVPNLLPGGPGGSVPGGSTASPRAESSAEKANRLTLALQIAAKFPAGFALQRMTWARHRTPLAFFPGQGGYLATAGVADSAGTGELLVYIADAKSLHGSGAGQALRDVCTKADLAVTKCTQSRKPNGDRIAVLHTTKPAGQVEWAVVAARTDGTWASATSFNYPSQAGASNQRPQRPNPPVTVERLSAIVLHPGLSFFPSASDLPLVGPLPASPAAPPPDVVPSQPASSEAAVQAIARMNAALTSALPLPAGAELVKSRFARAEPLKIYASQGGYKASADIVDPAGTGSLFVGIYSSDGVTLVRDACTEPNEFKVSCRVFRTETGDQVTVYRALMPGGVTHLTVDAVRLDGTQVHLDCSDYGLNSVPAVKNPPAPKSQRSSPTFTEQQLIDVALDPKLAFYP